MSKAETIDAAHHFVRYNNIVKFKQSRVTTL